MDCPKEEDSDKISGRFFREAEKIDNETANNSDKKAGAYGSGYGLATVFLRGCLVPGG